MLVASLEGVDDTEDLGGVAAGRGWVGENGADGFLRVDDEDGTDGERNALGVDVGRVLVVQHVVGQSNLAVLVTNYGEFELASTKSR